MIKHALTASALALALAACSQPAQPPETPAEPAAPVAPAAPAPVETAPPLAGESLDGGLQGGTDQWKTVASADDQDRIARIDAAWTQAMREADREFGAQIDALGLSAVKNAALAPPPALQPAPGKYRCRTLKFGSMDGAGLGYVPYPWFSCTVELTPGGDLILTKTGGSQRTKGLLYPDESNPKRLIYVGAPAWGADEKGFPGYGQMPERDQVGAFERIGNGRYRVVFPFPKQESKLDILEIRS
ncbi:MAG: DUF4893 domain-containing protein [Pseudomonadota bacterium]